VKRSVRRLAVALGLVAFVVPAAPAVAKGSAIDISVLSSRPDQVSGGDALVRIDAPRGLLDKLRVERDGADVTKGFERDGQSLVGLVDGLRVGENTLTVRHNARSSAPPAARQTLVNYPITGPIFSGPHQKPFVCKTIQMGLGEPLVDSHDGTGFTVLDSEGDVAGYSHNCSARTQVDYLYMSTVTNNLKALPAGERPADLATTKTLDGRTVDFIVRRERGTVNRFVYSYAMLAPQGADDRDTSLWNGRLIYAFDGGVAIGHSQGALGGIALTKEWLGLGYAVAYSSGTRTNTHYNLQLGGETALMTKERFVEQYGVPRYTVGVGGSGGGIQQYVYGQNHEGLIDAAVPQKSYSDMVTQGIHIGDCELLEHYMDVTDAGNPKWRTWENREWLEGLNASATLPNEYNGGQPGSSECVEAWRGLTPLTLNPLYGSAGAGSERMAPEGVMSTVEWTHADDLRNIYGEDPDGYARNTADNVGVQYGLKALVDGRITPAEFLDLNAKVGSWKDSRDMVQEGEPFVDGGGWDPWSSRNMRLSPDGGVTPAPRRSGSIEAMNAAYEAGLVFDGDIDIPVIDERAYLEEQLDMHNSHQSFATRQRMLDHDGDASNQVIWFSWPTPGEDLTPPPLTLHAFATIDEWMANIRRHPTRSVAENKPAAAVDGCFQPDAEPIAQGNDVWDGILNQRAKGVCTREFPIYSTSRMVAGGPIRGGVFKCQLQPVAAAIARGLYGSWAPSAAERARLEQIFPTGVCDYSLPDAGRP
jgi:hypothetical protein